MSISADQLSSLMSQMISLAPTNILLADKEGTLVFMNESSKRNLKTLEKYLPERVDSMVGK
jgi:hypothetical protein